jgi:hypothetical protein
MQAKSGVLFSLKAGTDIYLFSWESPSYCTTYRNTQCPMCTVQKLQHGYILLLLSSPLQPPYGSDGIILVILSIQPIKALFVTSAARL